MSNEIMLNSRIIGLTQINTALQGRINSYISQVSHAQQQISLLSSEANRLRQENAALRKDLERLVGADYKSKLSNPFIENSEQSRPIDYKAVCEKLREERADWMVSQKAFKELAIQFGSEKGMSVEAVVKMGVEKKLGVLDNRNNPAHNTNIDDAQIEKQYGEKFKKETINKLSNM